jgi:hypothetical protein
MCLAIYKAPKGVVGDDTLREGFRCNGDGAGFAYIQAGKVVIKKGFKVFDEFLVAYRTAAGSFPKSPFLIHFRVASQGDKSMENTHPFPIPKGALIHNGTITGTGATWGTGESDTNKFAQRFGNNLSFELISKNKKDYDQALDTNKVCILYDDGTFHILNEKAGHWENDTVWFSNRSGHPRGVPPQAPTKLVLPAVKPDIPVGQLSPLVAKGLVTAGGTIKGTEVSGETEDLIQRQRDDEWQMWNQYGGMMD